MQTGAGAMEKASRAFAFGFFGQAVGLAKHAYLGTVPLWAEALAAGVLCIAAVAAVVIFRRHL